MKNYILIEDIYINYVKKYVKKLHGGKKKLYIGDIIDIINKNGYLYAISYSGIGWTCRFAKKDKIYEWEKSLCEYCGKNKELIEVLMKIMIKVIPEPE